MRLAIYNAWKKVTYIDIYCTLYIYVDDVESRQNVMLTVCYVDSMLC